MTTEEISQFKNLFSKFCKYENAGNRCNDMDCQFCAVGRAYDEIFFELTQHLAYVNMRHSEYERANRLLAIESLEEMTDSELIAAGANTDQCEGLFRVEFNDGSTLNCDLCSGNHNYYDDVVWTSADGKYDITLDCEYEIGDIEFEEEGHTYIVRINVIDDE